MVTPIPTAMEVTGPGEFYETFMDDHDDVKNIDIPAKDTYAKFNYEAKEYFISGDDVRRHALQDPHRHPQTQRQYKIQRYDSRGIDAPERQSMGVPFHSDLLHDQRGHRPRDPDLHACGIYCRK